MTRTVTATTAGLYYAKASVAGFDVQVRPSVLNLQAGQTAQFRVTFTRTSAALGKWVSGGLTWTGGSGLSVHSPIALEPVALTAPAELTAPAAAQGSVTGTVTAGRSGTLGLRTTGLVAGDTYRQRIPLGYYDELPVTIPEGTAFTRFDVVGEDGSDVDMGLFTTGGDLVEASATASSDERIDGYVTPGDYLLRVEPYAPAPGRQDVGYQLTTYVLGAGAGTGSFTVAPGALPLTQGRPATFTASWAGLDPGTRYLGLVTYDGSRDRTVVTVG